MKIDVFITTEVFDRKGKLRYKRKRRSKSFVEAFLSIIKAQMDQDVSVDDVTNVAGTDRNVERGASNLDTRAAITVDTNGIVVGTGSTAVAVTDYALVTKIDDGSGSGQLLYQAVVISTSMTISDPDISFTIRRDFLNSSGDSITVNEVGIYLTGYSAVGGDEPFMAVRDLISGGQAVADGENLRVTYTIQTST